MIRVNNRESRSAAIRYLWLVPDDLNKSSIGQPVLAGCWEKVRPDAFEFAA